MAGGLADPAREEAGVSGGERFDQPVEPSAMLAKSLAERLGVLEEDVHPDRRVGAGHACHVAQRATPGDQRVMALDAGRSRVVDEQVGERVREATRERHEPVVRLRIDRHGNCAELADKRVAEPVPGRVGLPQRCQKPGRALEQLGARMCRARAHPSRKPDGRR